jgi:predicted nucleotidyltransferase
VKNNEKKRGRLARNEGRQAMKTKLPVGSKPVGLVADHLRKDANVDFGLLFGSQKTGKQKAGSDLDIAVLFKIPPEGMALLNYINTLSELTGTEIDLSVLNQASAFMRHQIFKTGVPLLIKDPVKYRKFREKTITDYQDFKYIAGMPTYD